MTTTSVSTTLIDKLIISKIPLFMKNIQHLLKTQNNIDISNLQVDHICYRCNTKTEYIDMKDHLENWGATLLVESMINGRPISIFKFSNGIQYENGKVELLELPCPSSNNKYSSGLQHIEVVLPPRTTNTTTSVSDSSSNKQPFLDDVVLDEFMKVHAPTNNTNNMKYNKKSINSDIEITFSNTGKGCLFDKMSCKFHAASLEDVVNYEIQQNMVESVPNNYFDDINKL